MHTKNKLKITIIALLLSIIVASPTYAAHKKVKNPFSSKHIAQVLTEKINKVKSTIKTNEQPISCAFTKPEKPKYSAKFIASIKKGAVAKGEAFETTVYIQNTGNMPWFSKDSGCPYLITYLGTDKERDRESQFATTNLPWESGWKDKNRIKMTTKRVDPGKTAKFTFWSKAPEKDGYFREYFAPVIEGVTWIDNGEFSLNIKVGNPTIDFNQKKYWSLIDYSANLTDLNFDGEKTIDVNISTQTMLLKIGDTVIKKFKVSTGKPSTPTPVGQTRITHKQEVRVAGSYPHYIMPKWMTYRRGGYGIHALPSLANDHGVFWREALNHIGQRRSHGCIRLLPKDAEYAYNFADIGTKVIVHY